MTNPRTGPRLRREGLDRREFLTRSASALVAGALWGCSEEDVLGGDLGDPRLTARPGTPTVDFAHGTSVLQLGGNRDGVLHVPPGYEPGTPIPLFVALHGAGGEGRNWSGFYDAADARGMALLAPDSRDGTWDRLSGPFGPDVSFIDEALAHTFDRVAIDPARIVLAGFSDGASYALSLGVSNGDLFTHLLGFSPGFFAPAEPIVGKPRIFVSHGARDTVLSVNLSRVTIVPVLQADGYDVVFREFDGGHTVPPDIGTAGLDWFLGLGEVGRTAPLPPG